MIEENNKKGKDEEELELGLEYDVDDIDEQEYTDQMINDDSFYCSSETQYFNEMRRYKLLTVDEEKKLFEKLKNGDKDARKELIERNLPLVVSIAKRYRGLGLPFLDIINEGNIGLIRAVDNFDISKEIKFSTYATTAIERQILREISRKGSTITIPLHLFIKKNKYEIAIKNLSFNLGRRPTDEEIMNYLEIDRQELDAIKKVSIPYLSLDATLTNEDDATYGDCIPNNDQAVETNYIEAEKCKLVRELLYTSQLSEREVGILELRFGILDDRCRTLDEVGKIFHITRERVRQIEKTALKKLRKKENTKKGYKLKEYL